MKFIQLRNLCLAGAVAIGLSACKDEPADAADVADSTEESSTSLVSQLTDGRASDRSPLLAYIPADTAYFATNLEALPEAISERIWQQVDAVLAGADQAAKLERDREEDDDVHHDNKLGRAIEETFRGKLSRQGLAELGFEPGDYYAVYGLGVWPVLRVSLSDPQRLLATIADIESRAEMRFDKQQLAGYDYYLIGEQPAGSVSVDSYGEHHSIDLENDGRLLVGIGEQQLVVSVMPVELKDQLLPQLLGVDKPAKSMADGSAIQRLNREFGFGPHGTALFNVVSLVEQVVEGDGPGSAQVFAELRDELTPVCRKEMLDLARIAPRFVAGYGQMDDRRIESRAILELRDDIASGIAELTLPIAAANAGDLFSMSMGFDMLKLKQFARDRVAAVKAAPFACDKFADINDTTEIEQALGQPLPPFVTNIKGLRFSASELEFGADGEPTGGKGLAMVVMDQPEFVLGMAQMFVPELAQLKVPDDGTPVELSLNALATIGAPPLHVAMTDDGLGFSIGQGQQDRLGGFLKASPATTGTLMSFSYDVPALTRLQMLAARQELSELESEERELAEQMLDRLEQAMAQVGEVSVDVVATGAGLEFDSVTTLN